MQKRTRKQLALVLTGAMAMSMMAGFGAYAEESSSDIGEPNGGAEVTRGTILSTRQMPSTRW